MMRYNFIQVSHTWHFGPTYTQGDYGLTCNLPCGAIPPTRMCSQQIDPTTFYVHVQVNK
jgi:hypothetical protein